MKLTLLVPSVAGLVVGYLLGAAAGRDRYRQITAAARSLITHPTVQQATFDLAGQARKYAQRVPGPAADLVDSTASRLQDTLTKPAADTTDSAETAKAATKAGPSAGPASAPNAQPGPAQSA